jgi:RNA polymerase sigma factor (sigma-70 family)
MQADSFDYAAAVRLAKAALIPFRGAPYGYLDMDDLVQEAMIGLIEGLRLGQTAPGGLIWRARCRVKDAIRVACGRPDRCEGRKKATARFRAYINSTSIDQPMGNGEEEVRLLDVLSDPDARAFEDSILLPSLRRAIEALPVRQRHVLQLYSQGTTMATVGQIMGISESRVSQIMSRIPSKMHRFFSLERQGRPLPVPVATGREFRRRPRPRLRLTLTKGGGRLETLGTQRRVFYVACADGQLRRQSFATAFIRGATYADEACPYKSFRGGHAFVTAWRAGRDWSKREVS